MARPTAAFAVVAPPSPTNSGSRFAAAADASAPAERGTLRKRRAFGAMRPLAVVTIGLCFALTARFLSSATSSLADIGDVLAALAVSMSIETARTGAPDAVVVSQDASDLPVGFYVVSLQGVNGSDPQNSERLDNFTRHWRDACGNRGIDFTVCPGMAHPKRGYGITQSFVNCFEKANLDNVSIAYFFEDDARLFNTSFCQPSFRTELHRKLPRDTYALLIGGHHWDVQKVQDIDTWNDGFVHVRTSYGAFGFALPHRSLAKAGGHFEKMLASNQKTLSPDISWYGHASQEKLKIYASNPLIVKHPPGYSNTWKLHRDGIEDEWPFQDTSRLTFLKDGRKIAQTTPTQTLAKTIAVDNRTSNAVNKAQAVRE